MAKIQLTKQQQQFLVIGAIWLIGGGYAYINYFWLPTATKIAKTQAEIDEVQGKILKAKGQAGRLEKIQREIQVLNDQAVEAEKRLPRNRDLPAVIDTLSALTQRHNLKLAGISVGSPSDKQYFTEISYALSITGTYHDIAKFFAAVALEQRIFNVRGVNFSGSGETLTASFQLIAYQYKG